MSSYDEAYAALDRDSIAEISDINEREMKDDEDHDKEDFVLVSMIRDTNSEVLAASLISALDRDKVSILINRLNRYIEL